MDPKVEAYIARSTKWPDEMRRLREVLLGCGLTEQIKWGKPCFSDDGHNIAILQEMNAFLSLMFFKGALMADPGNLLVDQGPNSRSAKRIEFTSLADVDAVVGRLPAYVDEALRIEANGITPPVAPSLELVDELRERLADDEELGAAFDALTPGRQREYNLHISSAKQSSTRHARIDKYRDAILAGKGMRD